MSFEHAIEILELGKSYHIYDRPESRLKQMIVPRVQSFLGRESNIYFKEFWALRDASFTVGRGETVGIIGRNGSGKSTLLQMICGTLTPTFGQINTHGRIAALLELGAGFNPEFTGRQNAVLNAQIIGLTKQEIDRKIDEIEAFADVGEFFDQHVRTYSSGMYVRVAFAVQAMVDPDILIVDEALAVGDAPFQAKCMARINRLKESGTSILFVSHDVGSVRQLCDKAVWLDKGHMRMIGDVMPVTSAYMENIFESHDAPKVKVSANVEAQPANKKVETHVPLYHYGSCMGIIKSIGLYNSRGQHSVSFRNRENITVKIDISLPDDIESKSLSVAFSIKSLNGTDIIVGSTWYDDRLPFPDDIHEFEVTFSFDNVVNSGEYMLVSAVEDRRDGILKYYEYIEGSTYFKIDHEDIHYGIVTPLIDKSISALSDNK